MIQGAERRLLRWEIRPTLQFLYCRIVFKAEYGEYFHHEEKTCNIFNI
jgi:hypothetical protein